MRLLWLSTAGCAVFPVPDASPPAVFDALWDDFDRHYGLFGVKPQVDWDDQYDALRPRVRQGTSDPALAEVLRDLLEPLDDDHVYFSDLTDDGELWTSWEAPREQSLVDLDIIAAGVSDWQDAEDFVSWGRLGGDVGYLRIHHFAGTDGPRWLAGAFADLSDVSGLVVDIRDTPGGFDGVAAQLAGCFARAETPFLTVRLRAGPDRGDFDEPIRTSVVPDPSCAWRRPVVLLTDAFTVSAGEVFSLAMVDLPGVKHVGEATTGSFSDAIGRELPNGWVYGVSVGDWRDENDVSYEGAGVQPEVDVVNTVEAQSDGRDLAIEVAEAEVRAMASEG